MSRHDGWERLLAGEPVGRRAVLRASGAAALGLPIVLSGCGTTTKKKHFGTDYKVAFNVGPTEDLIRLVRARARDTGMSPQAISQSVGDAVALLTAMTARSKTFVAQANAFPVTTRLALIGAPQAAQLEPIAAAAMKNGVKIVSYPVALNARTAAITVDGVKAATQLAADAAAWAKRTLGPGGHAVLAIPELDDDQRARDPYAPFLPQIEQALRRGLEQAGLTVTTSKPLVATDGRDISRLLRLRPRPQVVLMYRDADAPRVGREARAELSAAERAHLYVGALALPAISSRETLDELRRDDVLRAVVGSRLRDLADAMVDLPSALLNDGKGGDVALPLDTLTPRSRTLAAFERDYARRTQVGTDLSGTSSYLNLDAQGDDHPVPRSGKGGSGT